MKKALRYIIVGILLIGIVCGYYYSLSHRKIESAAEKQVETVSEVKKLLEKDLTTNYPGTPREVLKLYNRIICCFYNEEYTKEELVQLADMARMLLDDELLAANPYDQYFSDLNAEIAAYEEAQKTIVTYTISDSNDIVQKTVKGRKYAYADAYYFCREGTDYSRTYEEYVMRKDDTGKWKILAFRLTGAKED